MQVIWRCDATGRARSWPPKAGAWEGTRLLLSRPVFDSVAAGQQRFARRRSLELAAHRIQSILVIEELPYPLRARARPGSHPQRSAAGAVGHSQSAELGLAGVTSPENPPRPPLPVGSQSRARAATRARKVRQPSVRRYGAAPPPGNQQPSHCRVGPCLCDGELVGCSGAGSLGLSSSANRGAQQRSQVVASPRIPQFPRTSSIRARSSLAPPLAAVRRARRCRPCPSRLRSARLAWLRRA